MAECIFTWGPGEIAAKAERHPMSSTAVDTEATTAKGSGGNAPRDKLRSASDTCAGPGQAT